MLKIFTLWKFGICFFFLHFKNKLNFTLVKKRKTPYKACEEWLASLILYFMKSCKKIIYIIRRNKISTWTKSFYLLDCHPKCVSNPLDLKFLCALGLLERLVKTQTPLSPPRFFWFRRSVMRSRNIFISNEFPGANAAGLGTTFWEPLLLPTAYYQKIATQGKAKLQKAFFLSSSSSSFFF